MSNFKVFKLTGISCKSQLISCSSSEPDAWVSFADHCQEVAFLKMEVERLTEAWVDKKMQQDRDFLLLEVERLKNNIAYLDTKLDEALGLLDGGQS
jgi:hypothetical protein